MYMDNFVAVCLVEYFITERFVEVGKSLPDSDSSHPFNQPRSSEFEQGRKDVLLARVSLFSTVQFSILFCFKLNHKTCVNCMTCNGCLCVCARVSLVSVGIFSLLLNVYLFRNC